MTDDEQPDLERIVEGMAPAAAHCDSCRYWTAPVPPVLWGLCQRIDDCPDINSPLTWQLDLAYMPEAAPDVEQDGLCAHLYTQPSFGCVMWERRDI